MNWAEPSFNSIPRSNFYIFFRNEDKINFFVFFGGWGVLLTTISVQCVQNFVFNKSFWNSKISRRSRSSSTFRVLGNTSVNKLLRRGKKKIDFKTKSPNWCLYDFVNPNFFFDVRTTWCITAIIFIKKENKKKTSLLHFILDWSDISKVPHI